MATFNQGRRRIKSSNPIFDEFRAYWQLSEEMIAAASKEALAEAARIVAMQATHYARKCGELPIHDLAHLLLATTVDDESVGLLPAGTEALAGVLAMVAGVGVWILMGRCSSLAAAQTGSGHAMFLC